VRLAWLAAGLLAVSACNRSSTGSVRFHGVEVHSRDTALADVDAIGYEIDLRLADDTPGHETFTSRTTGTFVAARALRELALDLAGNQVDAVLVDGAPATFTRAGDTLTIALPRPVPRGRAFTATVDVAGALVQTDSLSHSALSSGGLMARQHNGDGRRIFNSFNWPDKARRWLALRDHPRDGALVLMHATFPRALTVLANGERESVVDNADGTRTWTYFEHAPMPTYDIHVTAYDDWVPAWSGETLGVRTTAWLYRGNAPSGAAFATVPLALQFLVESFGDYRWEKADYVEVPLFAAAMEHASLIAMNERSPTGGMVHELAHHWSGNLVRIASWNDLWLSEGFADYLDNRFEAARGGAEAERRIWADERRAALVAESSARHALRPADPEVEPGRVFDDVSYAKGAWVLRMLERRMGATALTRFLHEWFDAHAFAAAGTAELERALVAAWGAQATRFAADWIYDVGYPECRVQVSAAGDGVDIVVEQTQPRGPAAGFAFPLDLDFVNGGARQRVTLDVSARRQTVHARLPFAPAAIALDPDVALYATFDCHAPIPCH
jgi:aminopeptidase N